MKSGCRSKSNPKLRPSRQVENKLHQLELIVQRPPFSCNHTLFAFMPRGGLADVICATNPTNLDSEGNGDFSSFFENAATRS
jgi:hypothetical protein